MRNRGSEHAECILIIGPHGFVELRHFGGLSVEETAAVLGISTATVKREWRTAKTWLYRELRAR